MSFALYMFGLAVLLAGPSLGPDSGRTCDDVRGDRVPGGSRCWNHDGGIAHPREGPTDLAFGLVTEPFDCRDHVVVEHPVVTLAKRESREVCQPAVWHDDGALQLDRTQLLVQLAL